MDDGQWAYVGGEQNFGIATVVVDYRDHELLSVRRSGEWSRNVKTQPLPGHGGLGN